MNPKEESRDLRRKLNRERKKIGLLELKIHALRMEVRILRESSSRKQVVVEFAGEVVPKEPAKPEFSAWVMKQASEEPFLYLRMENQVRGHAGDDQIDFVCPTCAVPCDE